MGYGSFNVNTRLKIKSLFIGELKLLHSILQVNIQIFCIPGLKKIKFKVNFNICIKYTILNIL